MHQCPRCRSQEIHRSRTRSIWEGFRKELTGRRLYRCRACGCRGWGNPNSVANNPPAVFESGGSVPAPAKFTGATPGRESLDPADIDLDALDALEPAADRRK